MSVSFEAVIIENDVSTNSNQVISFKDLFKETVLTDNDNNSVCCISKMDLEDKSKICLDCGHKFNYIPLYRELCASIKRRQFGSIDCPYCRLTTPFILPNYDHPLIFPRKGVNYPPKFCMPKYSCSWIPHTGKNRFMKCTRGGTIYEDGIFCKQHYASVTKLLKNSEKKAEKDALQANQAMERLSRQYYSAENYLLLIQKKVDVSKQLIDKLKNDLNLASMVLEEASLAHEVAYNNLEKEPSKKNAKKEVCMEKRFDRANEKYIRIRDRVLNEDKKNELLGGRLNAALIKVKDMFLLFEEARLRVETMSAKINKKVIK